MSAQPHSVDQSGRIVPVNLRQSGRTPVELLISTRVRKSPYWHLSHEAGCWRATVYNRIYHRCGTSRSSGRSGSPARMRRGSSTTSSPATRPASSRCMRSTSFSATNGAAFSTTRCCCACPRTSSGSRRPTPTFCSGCRASTSGCAWTSRNRPGQRQGHRTRPLRAGTGARVGVERRNPVVTPHWLRGSARPDAEVAGHDPVTGERDGRGDAGGDGCGHARGRPELVDRGRRGRERVLADAGRRASLQGGEGLRGAERRRHGWRLRGGRRGHRRRQCAANFS